MSMQYHGDTSNDTILRRIDQVGEHLAAQDAQVAGVRAEQAKVRAELSEVKEKGDRSAERLDAIYKVLVWIGGMLTVAIGTAIAAAILRLVFR